MIYLPVLASQVRANGATFPDNIVFEPPTPFLVLISVDFGGFFLTGNKKNLWKSCGSSVRKNMERMWYRFSQILGLISVGREKHMFGFIRDNALDDTNKRKGENTATPDP